MLEPRGNVNKVWYLLNSFSQGGLANPIFIEFWPDFEKVLFRLSPLFGGQSTNSRSVVVKKFFHGTQAANGLVGINQAKPRKYELSTNSHKNAGQSTNSLSYIYIWPYIYIYVCCRVIIWAKFGVFRGLLSGPSLFFSTVLSKTLQNRDFCI